MNCRHDIGHNRSRLRGAFGEVFAHGCCEVGADGAVAGSGAVGVIPDGEEKGEKKGKNVSGTFLVS